MRYLQDVIATDLNQKMVFVGGPRQVGKTTLAKAVLQSSFASGRYFNWDYDEDRQAIRQRTWTDDERLIVLDELHKMARWKTWIKGTFDVQRDLHTFLVTGSARLDVYRKGGDSLVGRYHYWRLHPFSVDERPKNVSAEEALRRLMTVGGFPEPFSKNDETWARRWRRERLDRVIRDDIRDLESIRNIQQIALFLDLLRERVGGSVVLSNLALDVQVTPRTLAQWLDVLERMYLVFVVRPFTRSLPRAIQKPPKVYFYDHGDVIGDEGARFENVVAGALLKRLHFMEDSGGHRCELRYVRDKEGREVDFVVIKDRVVEELVEVKLSDGAISKSLVYFKERLKPKATTQIVANLDRPYQKDGIAVVDAASYLSNFQYRSAS